MQCPKCSGGLKMAERSGIEIDYCVSCRGIWLDSGELDKIIERSAASTPPRQERDYDRGQDRESWWERIMDVFD